MIFFLGYVVALIRAVCLFRLVDDDSRLLRCCILRHGLGTFADCVLGQFAGEEKAHGCLNFTAANGRLFVVLRKATCLGGNALEDVVHEAVHDGHGTAGDTGIGMDLLQDLVDVNAVTLLPLPVPPLPTGTGCLGSLLRTFLGDLTCWSHGIDVELRASELCVLTESTFQYNDQGNPSAFTFYTPRTVSKRRCMQMSRPLSATLAVVGAMSRDSIEFDCLFVWRTADGALHFSLTGLMKSY